MASKVIERGMRERSDFTGNQPKYGYTKGSSGMEPKARNKEYTGGKPASMGKLGLDVNKRGTTKGMFGR